MTTRAVLKRIGFSVVAAGAGIAAGSLLTGLSIALDLRGVRDTEAALFVWFSAFYTAVFVLPVWFFILLPLYVSLPASTRLWRPWPHAVFGAIAGLVIFGMVAGLPSSHRIPSEFYTSAAVVGAITCFTGACLMRRVSAARHDDI
jgi:hypothetical protein